MPVRKEKVDTRLVKNAESLAPIYELTHKPEVSLSKEHRKKCRGWRGIPWIWRCNCALRFDSGQSSIVIAVTLSHFARNAERNGARYTLGAMNQAAPFRIRQAVVQESKNGRYVRRYAVIDAVIDVHTEVLKQTSSLERTRSCVCSTVHNVRNPKLLQQRQIEGRGLSSHVNTVHHRGGLRLKPSQLLAALFGLAILVSNMAGARQI